MINTLNYDIVIIYDFQRWYSMRSYEIVTQVWASPRLYS